MPSGLFTAISAREFFSLALRARTDYDGDLLVYGQAMTANLNRSLNVAGNATVQSEIAFYNNPTVNISNSSLKIELGGASPGSQYDQLHVIGDVTLDGTLAVSLINGFAPPTTTRSSDLHAIFR